MDVVVGATKELDANVAPATIDLSNFPGSLRKGKDNSDTNCWASPSGAGFMIRGKNYLKDNTKVCFVLLQHLTLSVYQSLNIRCIKMPDAIRSCYFSELPSHKMYFLFAKIDFYVDTPIWIFC